MPWRSKAALHFVGFYREWKGDDLFMERIAVGIVFAAMASLMVGAPASAHCVDSGRKARTPIPPPMSAVPILAARPSALPARTSNNE